MPKCLNEVRSPVHRVKGPHKSWLWLCLPSELISEHPHTARAWVCIPLWRQRALPAWDSQPAHGHGPVMGGSLLNRLLRATSPLASFPDPSVLSWPLSIQARFACVACLLPTR